MTAATIRPVTRERVEQLARKYEQYPGALRITLHGEGIHEFAAALLAEATAPAEVSISREEWDSACAGLGAPAAYHRS